MLSLNEISEKYNIPKKTLRYYDEINLLVAIRKENNYRYYDEFLEGKLKYILVMKKGGFSLGEMKRIFELDQNDTKKNSGVINLIKDKHDLIAKEIEALSGVLKLIKLFEADCRKYDPEGNMKLVDKILGIGVDEQ